MPPRLPIPGSDEGTWGDILNEFLEVSHDDDGTLLPNTVNTSQIVDGAITNAKVHTSAAIAQSKISGLTSDLAAKANNSAVVHNTGNESIAGTKTFSSSPVVPVTPTNNTDAASKQYVDSMGGTNPSESGLWYPSRRFYIAKSDLRQDSGVTDFQPVSPASSRLLTGVAAQVISGAGNGNLRCAIYDAEFNLLQDLGTISATSTGVKTWTPSLDIGSATTIWIALCYQGSSTGTGRPVVAGYTAAGADASVRVQDIGEDSATPGAFSTVYKGRSQSGITGAFPSTASPTPNNLDSYITFYRFG